MRSFAVIAALLAVAALIRWGWLTVVGAAFPAAPFFPVVIVAAVYAGWRWGLAAVAASVVVVWGLIVLSGAAFTTQEVVGLAFSAFSAAICVLVAAALRSTVLRLRELENSLAQSQARLQLAQDVGGVGLWDWDMKTGQGYWSDAVYRNLGLDPSQGPDMRAMFDAIHPDDRDLVREVNRVAREDGRMEPVEYRVPGQDGGVRWLLSRGRMLRDPGGELVRAVGVNIDVTERRRAEDALRESEARFRALADSAPALMWVSRPGGAREFVNRAYAEFAGGGYEAALVLDWRERLHPDDLERILKEQVAGEASRRPFMLEARYGRADGEWRWLRSFSQPRLGASNEFNGFIGIAFDITEAKAAQHDLARINDLLAERMEAALAERDEAQAALVQAQKLEALGQLTGGVAHDFNNLLTVIIGALDILQRRPDDPERAKRLTAAALGAARRGEKLTQQLLAFSRRQPLRPEVVCVDELLPERETLYRRALGETVDLVLAPGADGACCLLDAAQFEAALLNLLVNARDAVGAGGVVRVETARVALSEPRGEIAAGDYVCVAVADDGEGMDAATLARAVEPFFTTKDVGKGTGLGLSQVHGFAHQSGGGVEIESAPGAGTTVRMLLPVSLESARPAEEAPAPPSQVAPMTVLLVEDDLAVADTIEAMLGELGHAVRRADAAEAALAEMDKGGVDLVLSDVVMPGARTGVELGAELMRRHPGLPVVLSSGYAGEALASAEAAPWPLLRKPYSVDALAAAIAQAVERTRED